MARKPIHATLIVGAGFTGLGAAIKPAEAGVEDFVILERSDRVERQLTRTTWMSGCNSWYLTEDGFNASMYPGFATQYLRQMRDFRFGDYDAVARPADASVSSSA